MARYDHTKYDHSFCFEYTCQWQVNNINRSNHGHLSELEENTKMGAELEH